MKLEGRTINVPTGKTIYHEGEDATHAIIIHTGIVKLHNSSFGSINQHEGNNLGKRLSDLAGENDIIGLHHQKHPHTATTATPANITIIEPKYLLKEGVNQLLLNYVGQQNNRLQKRMQHVEYSVPIRLGELIRSLIERFPESQDRRVSLPLPLTHYEMADLIQTNRTTVTRFSKSLIAHKAIHGRSGAYQFTMDGVESFMLDHLD